MPSKQWVRNLGKKVLEREVAGDPGGLLLLVEWFSALGLENKFNVKVSGNVSLVAQLQRPKHIQETHRIHLT